MDFFQAIRNGNVELVKSILNTDQSLASRADQRGFTPLVMATYSDQLEIVKLILEAGADVNLKVGRGNRALMGGLHERLFTHG